MEENSTLDRNLNDRRLRKGLYRSIIVLYMEARQLQGDETEAGTVETEEANFSASDWIMEEEAKFFWKLHFQGSLYAPLSTFLSFLFDSHPGFLSKQLKNHLENLMDDLNVGFINVKRFAGLTSKFSPFSSFLQRIQKEKKEQPRYSPTNSFNLKKKSEKGEEIESEPGSPRDGPEEKKVESYDKFGGLQEKANGSAMEMREMKEICADLEGISASLKKIQIAISFSTEEFSQCIDFGIYGLSSAIEHCNKNQVKDADLYVRIRNIQTIIKTLKKAISDPFFFVRCISSCTLSFPFEQSFTQIYSQAASIFKLLPEARRRKTITESNDQSEGKKTWIQKIHSDSFMMEWDKFIDTMKGKFASWEDDDHLLFQYFLDPSRTNYVSSQRFSNFINIFGSFDNCLTNMKSLSDFRFFHGYVNTKDVSKLFSADTSEKGTFMIRISKSNPDCFILSQQTKGVVRENQIRFTEEGVENERTGLNYPTIHHLVRNICPEMVGCSSVLPSLRSFFGNLDELQTRFLLSGEKEGSYIIRWNSSNSDANSLVVSSVKEGNVVTNENVVKMGDLLSESQRCSIEGKDEFFNSIEELIQSNRMGDEPLQLPHSIPTKRIRWTKSASAKKQSQENSPQIGARFNKETLSMDKDLLVNDVKMGKELNPNVREGNWCGSKVIIKNIKWIGINPNYLMDQHWKTRFKKLKNELNQRNIAKIYGVSLMNKQVFLVVEYLEGGSLHDFLIKQRGSSLTNAEWKEEVCIQISKGMEFIHSQNLIHRRLSTKRIFLTSDQRVKIADVGIGRDNNIREYCSEEENKDEWAPLEIWNGENASFASDVWRFGMCVWSIYSDGLSEWFHPNLRKNL
eukprot:TRINITY_DN6046_c0_g2_i1.p1 TRINITY_DN6046_c0_g2~~TRINITY_DN6046_c0_g2_i1.p1  ORF type:complete len:967 (-),score=325.97 TRINITY_DN6046_c0_g2_i1:1193-3751(-)